MWYICHAQDKEGNTCGAKTVFDDPDELEYCSTCGIVEPQVSLTIPDSDWGENWWRCLRYRYYVDTDESFNCSGANSENIDVCRLCGYNRLLGWMCDKNIWICDKNNDYIGTCNTINPLEFSYCDGCNINRNTWICGCGNIFMVGEHGDSICPTCRLAAQNSLENTILYDDLSRYILSFI